MKTYQKPDVEFVKFTSFESLTIDLPKDPIIGEESNTFTEDDFS